MLSSSTNNAFITSGTEILTLPIPVHISTESTDMIPNTAIRITRDALRAADAPAV